MRIVIDARLYGLKHRGIGRYLVELVAGLIEARSSHNFVLLVHPDEINNLPPLPSNFKVIRTPWHVYSLAEQIKLPWLILKLKADLVHWPHFSAPFFCPAPFIITIHDLILHHAPTERATKLPAFLYWLKIAAYRALIKRLVHQANSIITVSQTVADDICHYYPSATEKVKVIYLAAPGLYKSEVSEIVGDYVLMVGATYPHKNVERAIMAMAIVRQQTPNMELLLVGKIDFFAEKIKKFVASLNYQKWVRFVGEVSDKDLSNLYYKAKVFLLPSFQEGFGLGSLEALSYNIPVVAADIPVLKEVLGEAAIFVDPYSELNIAKGIIHSLDESTRKKLKLESVKTLTRYSWKKTVQETLAEYNHLVE